MFGKEPTEWASPIDSKYKPELDTTALITDPVDIRKFMSVMGALQWCISLGRFDIMTAVVSLGSFCVAPCVRPLSE